MYRPLDDNAPPAVIVYGTVCLDQLILLDEIGSPRGLPWEMIGGEAFNTATALIGWGVPVLLTGTALGTNPDSERLRRLLDDPYTGISRRRLPDLPTGVTPVCTIRISPNGERTMQGRGYAEAVAPPPLPVTDFANHPLVTIDPNLGQPAVTEALRAASLGCSVVAMDFQQHPDVCRAAYLVQTSREHLARFPLSGGQKASLQESAEALMAFGTPRLIVTDGAKGGIAAERQSDGKVVYWRFSAAPLEKVVDTTGAGDAFRAGLCWGLIQKEQPWSLPRLIRFASAAAALHCQVLGSGSRTPLEAVQRFAETMP